MERTICLAFFLISSLVFSQNQIFLSDKQYFALQEKTRSYFNSDIDSAFFYANAIEKSNNTIHKAFAIGAKGYLYAIKGDFKKANGQYNSALKLINTAPESYSKTQTKSYMYNYGGLINWKNGKNAAALDHYLLAKELAESINDPVQKIKINNNIALISSDAGNYKKAIAITRESEKFIDKNKHVYSESEYFQTMSNICMNIGSYYWESYFNNKDKIKLLDSAFYYYTKTLIFSKDIHLNRIKAQMNIGNIHYARNDFREAEKAYQSTLTSAKENDFPREFSAANYNLGFLSYQEKKYDKALLYFQKVDSLYEPEKFDVFQYINSNYYQAKIYDFYKDPGKAVLHSEISLKYFQKNELKLNNESLEVNFKLGNLDNKTEIANLQKKLKKQVLFKNSIIGFFAVLFMAMLFLFFRNRRSKKIAEQKVNLLIEQYNSSQIKNEGEILVQEIQSVPKISNKIKEETTVVSVDNEREIMAKLKSLEDKLYYLKPEFSQQEVAKKIKTNTTYLSYVVNKNYGKSFSVYYNELRINYVINEIIKNARYREYTTQAIAESAGFKNADSFTSSFKKKTGVTPYQFITEIKKRESI